MKRPKTEWQLAVRAKLDRAGMSYGDLAEAVGTTEGYVRKLMSASYADMKQTQTMTRVNEYLEID